MRLFPPVVETERLRLERLDPERVDPLTFYEVRSSDPGIEDVADWMPWAPDDHPEESVAALERLAETWTDRDGAHYAVRPREGDPDVGTFAGQAGLSVRWDRQVGTLGVWLRERFWGRGYSGERAAALLALAFERLDLGAVSVNHAVGNEQSRRAVEKYVERFGGRREGTLRDYLPFGEQRDAVRYTIAREVWEDNRPDDLGVRFVNDHGAATG